MLTIPVVGFADGPEGALSPNIADQIPTGGLEVNTPMQLALDGAGNLYLANSGAQNVLKVPTVGVGSATVVNTGSQHVFTPVGVAVDGADRSHLVQRGRQLDKGRLHHSGPSSRLGQTKPQGLVIESNSACNLAGANRRANSTTASQISTGMGPGPLLASRQVSTCFRNCAKSVVDGLYFCLLMGNLRCPRAYRCSTHAVTHPCRKHTIESSAEGGRIGDRMEFFVEWRPTGCSPTRERGRCWKRQIRDYGA